MIKWHRVWAYMLRHIYEIRGSLDRKVDIFFWPTMDLLTFGLLTVYINRFEVNPGLSAAIIGGLILWTLVYSLQRDIAVSLLEDAWSRNLFNLFSTPLRLSEAIAAVLLLSTGKALVTVGILTTLSAWLFHFNLFQVGPIIFFYLFSIFVFGWGFGYLTASLILRFGTRIQNVAWSLIVLIYPISGVFYPLSILPRWLSVAGHAFPIAYIFEGLRSIVLTGQAPLQHNIVVIAVLDVVYLVLGIWLFVIGFRHAKNRGWFIQPS